jgi:hypothetical protein
MKVSFVANIPVSNVDLIIPLNESYIYNEEWTMKADQDQSTFKLTVPNIPFGVNSSYFIIEGFSEIPTVNISNYLSDDAYNSISTENSINFYGFLNFTKYTNVFYLTVSNNWNCYNIYYGGEVYVPERIDNTTLMISGPGFDPSIETAYLHFDVKPFKLVSLEIVNDTCTIKINTTMAITNADFRYRFDPDQYHNLTIITSNITIVDLEDRATFLQFQTPYIPDGLTTITIRINYTKPAEVFVIFLFIMGGSACFIGAYYYVKNNEKRKNQIKNFIDEEIINRIEQIEDQDKEDKTKITKQGNKIEIEIQE